MNKYTIIILTILTSCGTVTQRIPNKMMITHLNNLPCDSSESNQNFFTYVDGEKINFEYQMVWIRFIGTHGEYDKINANTI